MVKTLKNALLAAAPISLLTAMPAFADINLKSDDYVGISFWLISMAMVASTAFFFQQVVISLIVHPQHHSIYVVTVLLQTSW